MNKLKPWVAGPFELIRHAEGHLKAGSDFDKRMALISYDNAIEVSITTFLQLHPSQRGGKTYERKRTEEWLSNYHKKLEFLESFAKETGSSLRVSIDEVIYYHNLRNELYHSGNGLVPECRHLDQARAAALSAFSCLFGVNAEVILKVEESKILSPKPDSRPTFTAQSAFLEQFIGLEKSLKPTLHDMGVVDRDFFKISMGPAWRLFTKHVGRLPNDFATLVEQSIAVRNAIVHGQPTGLDEKELLKLTNALEKVTDFVGTYAMSVDILPELRKRYPNWVREDLSAVRIIQKSGHAYLETTFFKAAGLADERVERMNLDVIGDDAADGGEEVFSSERTAAENAQKFISEMDPFSLMMVTDLFRPEAEKTISAEYGPTGSKK